MTLLEFINHLKHKNLYLFIYVYGKLVHFDTLGSYIHYKDRAKYDNLRIFSIIAKPERFDVHLEIKEEQ